MYETTHNRVSHEIQDHAEGSMTRLIENQVAKLPSDIWFGAALGSMGLALFFKLTGKTDHSLFVGQWAAPFLLIGVYLKQVKIGGSDRVHRDR
ncbi:MAG: hypothetical protein JNK57_08945 [Planctomycetaceae bacterium]|nr:hypothetical protein [Planctomycetaceae bacterium]